MHHIYGNGISDNASGYTSKNMGMSQSKTFIQLSHSKCLNRNIPIKDKPGPPTANLSMSVSVFSDIKPRTKRTQKST